MYEGHDLVAKHLGKLNAKGNLYHRSALQSLVLQAVTQRSVLPDSSEEFRDSNGHKAVSMKDLVSQVLYSTTPNIVLPHI